MPQSSVAGRGEAETKAPPEVRGREGTASIQQRCLPMFAVSGGAASFILGIHRSSCQGQRARLLTDPLVPLLLEVV